MFYSPSNGGFYLSRTSNSDIEITAAQHTALLEGQAAGKRIAAGEDGAPVLIDPPAPSMGDARTRAMAAMSDWIAQFLSQFTVGVSPAELASWPVKAERARQHLSGTPQPMIAAEAALTGEDADALAAKIVAKSDAYEAIIARTTGLRRATESAIAAAQTPEDVVAALASARTQAEAMAAALGVNIVVS